MKDSAAPDVRHPLADQFLLHTIVAVWGLTAVLGKGIDLPSPVLVAWRTLLAACGVLLLRLALRRPVWPGLGNAAAMLAVGGIIGCHWLLFFRAGKLGAVSVGLVGVATCSLWCALMEPFFFRRKRLGLLECGAAILVVAGAAIIATGDPASLPALLTGVSSAFIAAFFSYLNGRLVLRHEHQIITLYEMAGACLVMTLVATSQSPPRVLPTVREWLLLLLLSQICTVWAYSAYVGLLRRLSVFTVSLVSNLEPLYGIVLAAIIFAEHKMLRPTFWLGSTVVLIGVLGYPLLHRRQRRKRNPVDESGSHR